MRRIYSNDLKRVAFEKIKLIYKDDKVYVEFQYIDNSENQYNQFFENTNREINELIERQIWKKKCSSKSISLV